MLNENVYANMSQDYLHLPSYILQITYFPLQQQLLFWASDNTLSMNGWRSLNNNTHSQK